MKAKAGTTKSATACISKRIPPEEDGNYVSTGTQKDTGYGFHEAVNTLNPTSLGCGATSGDDAQKKINEIAEISDKALKSGGKSTVSVEED